jgi:hypothetical protein
MTPPPANAAALIAAGVACLVWAVKLFVQQRRVFEMIPSSNIAVQLPTKWDDAEVTRLLQRHQDSPAILAHAVSSIKSRMILNQDLKTAQARLKLVASVIEVFKLNRELQSILHDIHLEENEFEIKKIENQTRKEDAQAKLKSEATLRDLRKQRDELQLRKEISQLQQDIKVVENPAGSQQPTISPEQQRRLKRMETEDKLRELEKQEATAVKNARSDEERVRAQNMYADRRLELEEQLSKYL